MEKLLYFDYSAFLLELVLICSIVMRKMYSNKVNRFFLILVTVTLFTTAMDIAAVALDRNGESFVVMKYIFHSLYLFLHVLVAFFYLVYVLLQQDMWYRTTNKHWKIFVLFAPITFIGIISVINPFTGLLFYFNQYDEYTRGPLFLSLYVVTAYYSVFIFYRTIHFRKNTDAMRTISLTLGLFLILLAAIVQLLIPQLLLDMFALAIGLLFMFMMVQRPEEVVDPDTGLNNISSYVSDIRRSYANKKPETIIIIQFTNYAAIRDMLGYNDAVNFKRFLSKVILDNLARDKIRAEVYYIGSGCFRIRMDMRSLDKAELLANYINDYFRKDIRYNELVINLVTVVCVVRMPEDISETTLLRAFENDLTSSAYTGDVLYAADLYQKKKYDLLSSIDIIIDEALSENEFEVYYQPIYSIRQKRFNSAEALLRLKSKKYGFVPPDIFIPAAEKNGAIHKIGDIVMTSVCQFIGSDEFSGLGLDYIEVNLSPVQCMETNLAAHMIEIVKTNHVKPDQLNLEITETAAVEMQNAIANNINALYNAGISFSLDDFGTGYSNMKRIASMPFNIIKLDKTITQIDNNPNLVIVLENVVKMIKSLNMKIVAEGIETKELVERFSEMDCEYIQGYYYSRPLPKKELIAFLNTYNQTADV